MSDRIYGDKIKIDYDKTLDFFENRGNNKELNTKYNYVLFQDDSPSIAIARDNEEKKKISEKLSWDKGKRVLDIGCGIGRWGEYILKMGLEYIGIDYSSKLLKIANENLKDYGENFKLLHGSFQNFHEVLSENEIDSKFDMIFVNGVMMYINDIDLKNGLKQINTVCKEHCELYFKESMAFDKRLTLNDIYSDSLTQNYTAIYRSIDEYKEMLNIFLESNFKIKEDGALFDTALQNRKETVDYYFILER